MTVLKLKLNGEDVLVEFNYYKGFSGNKEEPPELPEIEFDSVVYEKVDVLPLLHKLQLADLESQIIKIKADFDRMGDL